MIIMTLKIIELESLEEFLDSVAIIYKLKNRNLKVKELETIDYVCLSLDKCCVGRFNDNNKTNMMFFSACYKPNYSKMRILFCLFNYNYISVDYDINQDIIDDCKIIATYSKLTLSRQLVSRKNVNSLCSIIETIMNDYNEKFNIIAYKNISKLRDGSDTPILKFYDSHTKQISDLFLKIKINILHEFEYKRYYNLKASNFIPLTNYFSIKSSYEKLNRLFGIPREYDEKLGKIRWHVKDKLTNERYIIYDYEPNIDKKTIKKNQLMNFFITGNGPRIGINEIIYYINLYSN